MNEITGSSHQSWPHSWAESPRDPAHGELLSTDAFWSSSRVMTLQAAVLCAAALGGEFHPAAENRTLGEVPARAAQRTDTSPALLASAAWWTGLGTKWTAKAWEDS